MDDRVASQAFVDGIHVAERDPGDVGAGLLAPGFGRIAARSRDRRRLVDAMAENAEVGALLRESAPPSSVAPAPAADRASTCRRVRRVVASVMTIPP